MFKFIKYKLLLFIFCFIFFDASISFAQFFNFTNYNIENGFPQSNAYHIIQDKDGYMWFSTQSGAAKFNGFDYTIFNKNNGLASNVVVHILQDKNERFWFSTKNGLTKFEKNEFTTFTEKDGLFSDLILKTFELPDNSIIISTNKGSNILIDNEIKELSKNIIPLKIIKRKNNEIWVLTHKNLYIYNNNEFIPVLTNIKKLPSRFNDIVEDKNSNIWIASDKGIYKLSETGTQYFNEKDGLLSRNINRLLIDSNDNLWYSSEDKGCGFIKNNIFHNITVKSGLTNSVVLSLFEDSEKNIWIGGRNGVTMINTHIPFIHYDKISPFENEIVMGMKSDENNNIWFCTYGFGIAKFDGKNYKYFNKEIGSIDNSFFDVEIDNEGNLWFASGNSGIIKYDGKTFNKIKVDGNYINKRILTICKDYKNNLWFGTNGDGIYKYNGKTVSKFGRDIGFDAKNILSICEDIEKNIWFGTVNEGLYKFDGEKIYNIGNDIDFGYIRTIVNKDSNLWIGTSSNGIYKIIKENKKYQFEQYKKTDGINSNNIYLLYPDSKGNLWCGSEKGVDKLLFDSANSIIEIRNYTKDEGFIGIETNINAALEDHKGNMWFGTVNGAVKYNESADTINITENKTYITGIRLFFEEIDWNEYSDSVNYKNIPINLTLPYNQNHLSFDFIGLCYSNPKKVKYKYRLLGQNEKWSPATYDQKAVFTNIAPGKYEFQIISANNDDIWNTELVSFNFIIKPPLWQKIWFRTILLLFAIILIYLIIDFRLRSLKNAKNKLELKVNERTAELNEQKEKLQKTNNKITDSINYAGKIQSAMLPSLQIFENNFSEYCIINHPRDIVSGDFYWAREITFNKQKYIISVVADCTGHGIPGALVSMLGMSLLNEIIRKEEITQANQVLEELRKEIKISLKQKGELDDQTEGIDMVICFLNKVTNELQFSGANNPLYLIRNNELTIYKSTINPVGIFIKEIPFINTIIQLEKGDILYLFSDGYIDQFNGKTDEKFKIKRFKELLLSISDKTMDEQKQILEDTFTNWKAGSEQIDDILILGLKI